MFISQTILFRLKVDRIFLKLEQCLCNVSIVKEIGEIVPAKRHVKNKII